MTSDNGLTSDDLHAAYREKADETDESGVHKARNVLDMLTRRLKNIDDPLDQTDEFNVARDALRDVADETGDVEGIISYISDKASKIAEATQIKKDRITGALLPELRELQHELAVEEAEQQSGGWTLSNGVGIDEYIEDHLERIVVVTTTDHVDDKSYLFVFDTGVQIQFSDKEHLTFERFDEDLANAVGEETQLLDKFASWQAAERIQGDVTEDESEAKELYAKLSLGPSGRPWAYAHWRECIMNLVKNKSEPVENPPVGARTEAWEKIQNEIKNGTATTSKADAVDHKAVYVAEDLDEVWVPTQAVDNACEDVATSRKKLVYELDERGVSTDLVSGRGMSERVTERGRALRMWRFDATHDDVPMPEDPEESLSEGGFGNMPDSGNGAAAADGGVSFDPISDNSDENDAGDSE